MHSLNIKLTYKCTNNCNFCFSSSYYKNENISKNSLINAIKNGYENGCTSLVISGGEPTIYPNTIIELIEYSNLLGYKKYTIQTNGFGLSKQNELLDFLTKLSLEKEVVIAFSVHGSNSKIHDEMSSKIGAFDKTMNAIKNIHSQTNCKICTNTVISTLNINNISEIIKLITPYKPCVMQFAIMHTDDNRDKLSTSMLAAAKAIYEIKDSINKEILQTEGIPYCLLKGLEECVGESYWPKKLDLFNKEDEYIENFNQLESGMRKKADFCKNCIMNEICAGVWSETYNELIENAKAIF